MNEKAQVFWQRVLSRVESQQDLARKAGIQRGTISTQISGQRLPKLEDALKIAQALNMRLEDLLDLEYIPTKTSITSMADISDRLEILRQYTSRSMKTLLHSPLTQLVQEMHTLVKTLEKMNAQYTVTLPLIDQQSSKKKPASTHTTTDLSRFWVIHDSVYEVPAQLIPSGEQHHHCVLKAQDSTMVNAGIDSGSYCLIRKSSKAEYGQIVVVHYESSLFLSQFVRSEDGRSMFATQDGSNRTVLCTPAMEIVGVFVQVLRAERTTSSKT